MPPSPIIDLIRSALRALPVGCSLKRRTWLMIAAPTNPVRSFTSGQASRQRQQEMRHGRLHALGQRALIEVAKRPGTHTRHRGGSFEQSFQVMVVVLVEAAD